VSDYSQYLIYLLEQYALSEGITGDKALAIFEQNDLLPYIHDRYYTYHTERVENAIDDINAKLREPD
jgi:hypothetical protein